MSTNHEPKLIDYSLSKLPGGATTKNNLIPRKVFSIDEIGLEQYFIGIISL